MDKKKYCEHLHPELGVPCAAVIFMTIGSGTIKWGTIGVAQSPAVQLSVAQLHLAQLAVQHLNLAQLA